MTRYGYPVERPGVSADLESRDGQVADLSPCWAGVDFEASDYWAPTPDWALYGSDEAESNGRQERC